jgi:hypothetical protein
MDVYTDNYIGNCRAVIEPFVETVVETIVRLPSILVLCVSRALELCIGLRVNPRAELRAELQGGDPLGPPSAHYVLYLLRGQSSCRGFSRGSSRDVYTGV